MGGLPLYSIPRPHAWGARCRVRGSPSGPYLRAIGLCFWVRGPPPPSPLSGRTQSARATVWVGSAPCCRPPACRALGARAARYRPLLPYPSSPVRTTPLCPCGHTLLPGALRWIDPPLAPLEPVCCTHCASACRFWACRCQHHRNTAAGPLGCPCLSPCPAVGAVVALSSARTPCPCRRCRLRPLRLLRWWEGFLPLPIPVCPLQELPLPRCPLREFFPLEATGPLRGCRCPAATLITLPLPGGPPPGFSATP